ncbi:MAG: methyltransferase domain-containing protein [Alkalispirochaeta sp.]
MGNDSTFTAHKKTLILAEHRVGHGSGHLHRCARLAPRLEGEVDWCLPENPGAGHYRRDEALAMIGDPNLPVRWVDEPEGPYDLVILDRRSASLAELKQLPVENGIVIGIDLAGEARNYCSYLIDALETPPGMERPNVADAGLLHLPNRTRTEWPREARRILVAFGGESSEAGADFAAELTAMVEAEVFLVSREPMQTSEGVTLVEARGDLPEKLADFDLVITHYGLTPYEAIWARVPVLLRNPGKYHSILSRAAGFTEIGSVADVTRQIREFDTLCTRCERIRPRGSTDIAALINEIVVPGQLTPPTGGDRWQKALHRYGERTFFTNERDDVVYMHSFRGTTVDYDHDYFFSEYARQYGKTYLEDFPHILETGRRRAGDIRHVLSRRAHRSGTEYTPRLLDIGCAYGPFLKAASDAGFSATGIDIACEATQYVEKELGIPAICGDIRTLDPGRLGGPFDVVTMWFVIEHFDDLEPVVEQVQRLLRPGGLFVFSTPNGAGVSAQTDAREFYRRSPSDHYTVMNPRSARKFLEQHRFVVRRVRVTGHHPERFAAVSARPGGFRRGVWHRLFAFYSRARRLGDTFEIIGEFTP